MSTQEQLLFAAVPHSSVKMYLHRDIQGEPVPMDEAPFVQDPDPRFDVIGNEEGVMANGEPILLRRISNTHGRSYAMTVRALWRDRFGNLFSALNTKGNNVTAPEAFKTKLAPSGFAVYGLQDSDSIVRVLRASNVLRERNIPAEMIVRVMEPAALPLHGEELPLAAFKARLVQDVLVRNGNRGERVEKRNYEAPVGADIPALIDAMRNMTFFVTVRGMEVNERLGDLFQVHSPQEFSDVVFPAMEFLNREEQLHAKRDPAYVPRLCEFTERGVEQFLYERLPERAARNIAGMHNAGLAHVFLHHGNLSMTGAICDLDSVCGEPLGLGDQPFHPKDILRDITQLFRELPVYPETFQSLRFARSLIQAYIRHMTAGSTKDSERICRTASRLMEHFETTSPMQETFQHYASLATMAAISPESESLLQKVRSSESVRENHQVRDERLLLRIFLENGIVNRCTHHSFSSPDFRILICKFADLLAVDILSDDEGIAEPDGERISSERKQAVIRDLGFEENVAKYADVIDSAFDKFHRGEGDAMFQYYYAKLREQLGFDFKFEDSIEQVIAEFHRCDDVMLRTCARQAAHVKGKKERWEAFYAELRNGHYEFHGLDRYVGWVNEMVGERIQDFFAKRAEPAFTIAHLDQTYGKEASVVICEWLHMQQERELNWRLPPATRTKIDEDTMDRLAAVFAEYDIHAPDVDAD